MGELLKRLFFYPNLLLLHHKQCKRTSSQYHYFSFLLLYNFVLIFFSKILLLNRKLNICLRKDIFYYNFLLTFLSTFTKSVKFSRSSSRYVCPGKPLIAGYSQSKSIPSVLKYRLKYL